MAVIEPDRKPLPPFTRESALSSGSRGACFPFPWAQVAHRRISCLAVTSTYQTQQQVALLQDAWNTKDPEKVSKAYTLESNWRNRDQFFKGREKIKEFLTAKWEKEQGYRLKKTLWCFEGNRIAVCFEYEYHDENGQWYRAHGNENWQFDDRGYMEERWACINDIPIKKEERRIATD